MFCNQCEQTAHGQACDIQGVCGKSSAVALEQDTLIFALRTLARAALKARMKGHVNADTDAFMARALFATLTNVNFDTTALTALLEECLARRKELAAALGCTASTCATAMSHSLDELRANAGESARPDYFDGNADVRSAMQLLLYGLKGVAAYVDHAARLGQSDPALYEFLYRGLVAGFPDCGNAKKAPLNISPVNLEGWLALVLECGQACIRAMELLEKGHIEHFGNPVPTAVSLGVRPGKAILVSGHDLGDLYALLEQTAGTGIQVYTHGEMLPAHAYPKLHEYAHLAGHFGTAWQNQGKELPHFPGPVLFTTNCIQNPVAYADKVFTTGTVGWPGVEHCPNGRFEALIAKALAMPGFPECSEKKEEAKQVLTGFGRKTLLDAAPAVLDAIRQGALRHIFLVGGCDGAKPGRNYYSEFVELCPQDTLILTLACGKFRFFDKELGTVGAFPRLMDVGQCNDAYAAVKVALALAENMGCSVNELPLSFVLSWYEQKAVAILLALLSLGVRNIYLGPSLPAFISPNILAVLVERFAVHPISSPEADLAAMLGQAGESA